MIVRVLSGFSLGGGKNVAPGEVVEVEDWNGRRLIAMGFVAAIEPAPAPAKDRGGEAEMPAVDEVESREPEPESREPRRRSRSQ